MNVTETLKPDSILINVSAKNQKKVLKLIIHQLYLSGNVIDEKQFLKDVFKRESQGITGMGNGLAIPHGKSKSVTNPVVGIATLKNPIEWESLDDKPIQVVVLLAVPDVTGGSKEHLKLLAEVSKKLANEEILNKLKQANNTQEIISSFEYIRRK